jgi:hypothetical protein
MNADAGDFWGEPISTYSRAQAIEDGELVDVSIAAQEAGITFPTALTRHVWNECVEVPPKLKGQQDESGRLWDVLYMAAHAVRAATRAGKGSDRLPFTRRVRKAEGHRVERLLFVVGPGDDAAPVVTIEYPEDD